MLTQPMVNPQVPTENSACPGQLSSPAKDRMEVFGVKPPYFHEPALFVNTQKIIHKNRTNISDWSGFESITNLCKSLPDNWIQPVTGFRFPVNAVPARLNASHVAFYLTRKSIHHEKDCNLAVDLHVPCFGWFCQRS